MTSTQRKLAHPAWRPYINKTNIFTKVHNDWEKHVTSRVKIGPPPPSIHVLQRTGCIFELNSYWAKNVNSRVFTSKTGPLLGGHVFSPIWTIFEIIRDINTTKVLTKFHDDWAKFVTSGVKTASSTALAARFFNGQEPLFNSTNISFRQTF
ncbi:hypothetical protein DPMN_028398 [Dreissena polymorpha]|uniref:Uncharacterized protein n=1 Tax=Dreissena polymorpha TaxID=45954 RepID=A0A9D4LX35_DREPO|nr:hypothetical protein DPMN_028398 [Dreissena polymorpha]